MSYRDSASYGKRQEYRAVSKLLERDFDVYMTLVDDMGIDCVLRINDKRYLDIQIKARSANINEKNFGYFPLLTVPEKRNNYFFIFYVEKIKEYWVIPSEDVIKLADAKGSCINKAKSGKNIGKYAVRVTGIKNGQAIPKKQFDNYRGENGFKLLK